METLNILDVTVIEPRLKHPAIFEKFDAPVYLKIWGLIYAAAIKKLLSACVKVKDRSSGRAGHADLLK